MMQSLLPSRLAMRSGLTEVVLILTLSGLSLAQSPPASAPSAAQTSPDTGSSLAAAARNAKAQNAPHAKKVFTDEDMELQAGPLPRLKMDGAENADDVTAAIAKYKLTHTAQQTEDVVHAWYDRYDSELAAEIQANRDTTSLRPPNGNNGHDLRT